MLASFLGVLFKYKDTNWELNAILLPLLFHVGGVDGTCFIFQNEPICAPTHVEVANRNGMADLKGPASGHWVSACMGYSVTVLILNGICSPM
jgi:hypothetical protein